MDAKFSKHSSAASTAPNGRPTVGLLFASLHTGASRAVLPGVLDAAEQQDVNLICFPGGRLGAPEAFEAQRNVIYDLAGPTCLDGLITWSSSLAGAVGWPEVMAFHRRFRALPMVSLSPMEGVPAVAIDSYQGMRALLRHLVEGHGYRRLAFIRGPEEHYPAQERYRAYLDSLQAYGIPFAPELVTRPLRWEAGVEAVEILLDERGLLPGRDFQVLVTVSDLLALWALKTLQGRGFRIPEDVTITGFNNSTEESLATPPLTTVELPFYDQGAEALKMLLAHARGETVPALITLPSRLVMRQSCGCPPLSLAQAAYLPHVPTERVESLASCKATCLEAMRQAAGWYAERWPAWFERLWQAYRINLEEIMAGGAATTQNEFLKVLREILEQALPQKLEIVIWQDILSALRQHTFPLLSLAARADAEAMLAMGRILVSEVAQRSHAYWQWQADRQDETLRETIQALLTSFNIQQLSDVLINRLPRLGIPSAYLALYEDPASREYAHLVMAYQGQERLALDLPGQRFLAQHLVPPDLLPADRRYSLVVEPLFFQEKAIGFAIFEIGPREGQMYELLRSNLSSALQGALLFQEIEQARRAAEKADRIKSRLLANVSHEMRTPLNIILGYTQNALQRPNPYGDALPSALLNDLVQIQSNAEHQLRVINDLLDLSRAEIDELDLSCEWIDPRPLLVDAFHSLANQESTSPVAWQLALPDRLPLIHADAVRLRQILLNLLSNARKFTPRGQITLGAEVIPPHIHFWVADTGPGIPPDQQERIFEPFVTIEQGRRIAGGIGLGLSITRHLVALHGGSLTLDSQPERGSTFHVYLPLPALDASQGKMTSSPQQSALLLISPAPQLAPEIVALAERQKLQIHSIHHHDELDAVLAKAQPAVVVWDVANAQPGDWSLVRRLRHDPRVSRVPFILYGQFQSDVQSPARLTLGMTGFVVKSNGGQSLVEAIEALAPHADNGFVLIVDDDAEARLAHQKLVAKGLPGYAIRFAANGRAALEIMADEVPALVLLDMIMPEIGGAEVLDHMRASPRLRQVPVIVLSNRPLSMDDAQRLEAHSRVTFQSKGVWSETEVIRALHRSLFGTDVLPSHTSAFVKRAVAFLHQNYAHVLSRWEIAEAIGVSEDYLSRIFSRELGLTPWDYLNRYRILQAKAFLLQTQDPVSAIAHRVGFKDQAYFSRVFHKLTGQSPQAFRDAPKSAQVP